MAKNVQKYVVYHIFKPLHLATKHPVYLLFTHYIITCINLRPERNFL